MVVAIVISAFKLIPDKKIASLVAGSAFLLSSILISYYEGYVRKEIRSFSFLTTAVFLLLAAIPIFSMRVLFWSSDFQELELLGMKMELLHKVSNYLFMLMLIGYFVDSMRKNIAEAKEKSTP